MREQIPGWWVVDACYWSANMGQKALTTYQRCWLSFDHWLLSLLLFVYGCWFPTWCGKDQRLVAELIKAACPLTENRKDILTSQYLHCSFLWHRTEAVPAWTICTASFHFCWMFEQLLCFTVIFNIKPSSIILSHHRIFFQPNLSSVRRYTLLAIGFYHILWWILPIIRLVRPDHHHQRSK